MTETATFPLLQGKKKRAAAAIKLARPATDFELAQRAAAGDMNAFEELYERHSRRVYSLCLRMTANTAEAEDLAQEAFIQLFRKIGSFRGSLCDMPSGKSAMQRPRLKSARHASNVRRFRPTSSPSSTRR